MPAGSGAGLECPALPRCPQAVVADTGPCDRTGPVLNKGSVCPSGSSWKQPSFASRLSVAWALAFVLFVFFSSRLKFVEDLVTPGYLVAFLSWSPRSGEGRPTQAPGEGGWPGCGPLAPTAVWVCMAAPQADWWLVIGGWRWCLALRAQGPAGAPQPAPCLSLGQ